MRELVFALEFRGSAGAIDGSATGRRARTSAPSQTLRAVMAPDAMEAGVEPLRGDTAVLESTVERFADGSFVEAGIITYGGLGRVSFSTVGKGTVGPSPTDGWVHGAVMWVVTGGDGWFTGARGLITSNFVASAGGEVIDNQFARLYLPSRPPIRAIAATIACRELLGTYALGGAGPAAMRASGEPCSTDGRGAGLAANGCRTSIA